MQGLLCIEVRHCICLTNLRLLRLSNGKILCKAERSTQLIDIHGLVTPLFCVMYVMIAQAYILHRLSRSVWNI